MLKHVAVNGYASVRPNYLQSTYSAGERIFKCSFDETQMSQDSIH